MNKLFAVLILCVSSLGQTVIQGNSLAQFAPWSSSGIVPAPIIRGHDSYMCYQLAELLPYDVPLGTTKVVLIQGTNDVHMGVTPEQHEQCLEGEINWLQANRPGILIYLVNVPSFGQNNCYGDYRQIIADYNALYKQLGEQYSIPIIDVHTIITAPNGWAYLPEMDGLCLIHPGQFEELNAGWSFFMGMIKSGIEGATWQEK